MQPLDKNQIGNGYLEEYGLSAIVMDNYNTVLDNALKAINRRHIIIC
jgi:hypothetical protein